jgi:hypothetical protein
MIDAKENTVEKRRKMDDRSGTEDQRAAKASPPGKRFPARAGEPSKS